ncbi:MAG: hypothetical protein JWR88_2118 [Pseudonocardia sp.]|nr:hypothetical protein [Pseudonocardia sp.]
MAGVRITVDGVQHAHEVEPRLLLVQYLRERLGKTGTVVGCDTGNCGSCTVHLDGQSVKSCAVLAVQADGAEVTTIEGLPENPIGPAFRHCHAVQCGFCTPGMIMQAVDLLAENPDPDEGAVRAGVAGNLCRCTGYENIVSAILWAAQQPATDAGSDDGSDDGAEFEPEVAEPEVGRPRRRKEDARLIAGRSRWTDNITLPGMLHMTVVRSPHAHAKITRIDRSAATRLPGVLGVFTATDLGAEQIGLPCAWPITPDMKAPQRPPLALETVHFAGEGIAVVIAEDAARARDAAEAVVVDYDLLPPVLDMPQALAEGATLVHPNLGTNRSAQWAFDSGEAGTGESADTMIRAAEMDPASVVLRRRFRQQRVIPAFLEPRSVVVDPTGEQITIWSSTQMPHLVKTMAALICGIGEHRLRVIAPDVGGGFGGKIGLIPEEVLSLLVAVRLGRPVKWTETRSESMLAAHHGRDQIQDVTLAANRDGTVAALKVDVLADMGAYLGLMAPGVPLLGALMYNSIYRFLAYQFSCTTVLTTKTPVDYYRGAGRPEASFAIERMMDELAERLGRDPLELRAQNWISQPEFPFDTVAGLSYDSGNYEAAADRAMQLFDYPGLRREQEERRRMRDPVQLGIGISTYADMCGFAPSRMLGALAYGAGGWEHASIRMLPTGKVEVVTGTSPHGQGHVTTFSQLVAEVLGVSFSDVSVLHGDTHVAPKGMDTYGSRSLVIGGSAVLYAAQKVLRKAHRFAAYLLDVDETDLEFRAGRFWVRGTERGIALPEVAFATFTAHNLPTDVEPSLDSDATFDPVNFSFPHGTHLAAVEVDTETGQTSVRSYVAVDDVGVVVNPLIVDGQVHGGLAQGIGQALYEQAIHDAAGTLVTGTLAGYTMPAAADLPSFVTDRTKTPATTNPIGAKGAGEIGAVGSPPAIVNGIVDALRHLGVHDVEMPCTPERVWRALHMAPVAMAQDAAATAQRSYATVQHSSWEVAR